MQDKFVTIKANTFNSPNLPSKWNKKSCSSIIFLKKIKKILYKNDIK